MSGFQVIGRGGQVWEMDGADVMGLVGRSGKRKSRSTAVRVTRAPWREGQLAPGVQMPDTGLLTLPLRATDGTGTFALAAQSKVFEGRLQKPFRGERLLLTVVRTGASAVGRLLGQIFVGTDLQQADITRVDLEQIGNPLGFGLRLAMSAAQPGVTIAIDVVLSAALAGADTIFATMQLLGQAEH